MKLKASVAMATLAISLSAGAGACAEACRCAQRAAPLPVVVQEYYPHTDRRPAPVEASYAPPPDTYGFADFDYADDSFGYDGGYVGGYGLGGYGFGRYRFRGDGDRSWDNDRGGGHSRVRGGRSGMGGR
jgi:hypothetical protein